MLRTVPVGGRVLTLTDTDLKEIEKIEAEYYSESWLRGKNPKGSLHVCERFDGVGEICVDLSVSHGLISDFEITGDYLENADAATELRKQLVGVPYELKAVSEALASIDIPNLIPSFTSQQLVNLIF